MAKDTQRANDLDDSRITSQIDVGGWWDVVQVTTSDDLPCPLPDLRPAQEPGKPPQWMQHVQQHEEYDCGLTTAAMAGGLTYEQAESFDPRPKPLPQYRGLWAREMVTLLTNATGKGWRVAFASQKNCRICEYRPPEGVDRGAMLTKYNPKGSHSHWVAFAVNETGNVWVFDPCDFQPSPACFDERYVRKLVVPRVK
jgi:hypothetical protein